MHTPRRLALALGALAAWAAISNAAGPADAQPTTEIAAQNLLFAPQTLVVSAGSTVVWTNEDPFTHTVTADDGSFDLGFFDNGQTVSMTFATPGTYSYYCIPHGSPGGNGMAGTIVVQ